VASKSDIKKFRHDISTLKKRGLVTGVDARSATPTRKLRNLINRYDDVLSGKATAVKLTKSGINEYKELGKPFRTVKPSGLPARVVIPHTAVDKVIVTRGKARIISPHGIERTILPVPYRNLEQYLSGVGKQKIILKPGERLAFRFFDNQSIQTFKSVKSLIDYLNHYESVFDAIEENNAEAQGEIYQNLEIIKIDQPTAQDWGTVRRGAGKGGGRSGGKRDYQERKRKLKEGPDYKREEYKRQQAERQREYRERLKGAELEKYKAAGRKRAKKSKKKAIAKRKGKKK
jgi:hypothetical protein